MLKKVIAPLLLTLLISMSANGLDRIIPLQEGGTGVSEFTLEDLGLGPDVIITSSDENVSASAEGARIVVTASGDWHGTAMLDIDDGSITVQVKVIVEPVNDPPIIRIEGDPASHSSTGSIDLVATGIDPEGKGVHYRWEIDGMVVSTEPHLRYHVMPGSSNLTLTVTDEDGMYSALFWELDPRTPVGWEEDIDEHRNRITYWVIFGSSGSIFVGALVWILIWNKKEKR